MMANTQSVTHSGAARYLPGGYGLASRKTILSQTDVMILQLSKSVKLLLAAPAKPSPPQEP